MNIQKQIVDEYEIVDKEFKTIRMEEEKFKTKIDNIFAKFDINFIDKMK